MDGAMDATQFFNANDFARSPDGALVVHPSQWVNTGFVLVRMLIAFIILFTYFWVYPTLHPSVYFLLVPILVVIASIIKRVVHTHYIEYEIKDDKLIFREGVLTRHMGAVNIARIQNTDVKQSLVEQFFGIGTVMINTDDSMASMIWMIGMQKPDQLRAAILDASEAVRKARGLYEFVRP